MINKSRGIAALAIVCMVLCVSCGDDAEEGRFDIPPQSMRGQYSVTLSGYWEGTTSLSISDTNVSFSELIMSGSGWNTHLSGPYDAISVIETDESWIFRWDMDVNTNGMMVRQQWEVTLPMGGITGDRLEGGYTHTSDLTGTHTGTLVANRT